MRVFAFGLSLGPVLFGIGFLAPVIAALLDVIGMERPLGLSPIVFGLIIGTILGFVARQRRTWLW